MEPQAVINGTLENQDKFLVVDTGAIVRGVRLERYASRLVTLNVRLALDIAYVSHALCRKSWRKCAIKHPASISLLFRSSSKHASRLQKL